MFDIGRPSGLNVLVSWREHCEIIKNNHVLPGTTILSDCWAAYNRIIDLDRQYDHRTVNHSLTFVAPDGTHTNSIESTWRAAKRQFKEMNGVSRLYLQAYLDEYCWRLENGNRNGWMVYESIIRAIRDYFRLFPDANAVLDETIHRENHIINRLESARFKSTSG